MLNDFHFTEPLWLLMLLPVIVLAWLLKHRGQSASGWEGVIDNRLLTQMLGGKIETSSSRHWANALLMLGWSVAVIALANPVWEKKPVPVYQTNAARVIVLDLSLSMTIQDVKPSRLQRARFKVEDLLARQTEGLTGLVVFSGSAFTVSPLTRDNRTISALLKSLDTSMMPSQGSRADLGLLQAGNVLQQAGITQGDIVLVADGAIKDKAVDAVRTLASQGYRTSVLAIGSELGAPIPNIRTRDDQPIVVAMEKETLQAIAAQGGGVYQELQASSQDINRLVELTKQGGKNQSRAVNNRIENNDWYANGPWLLFILLPIAAIAFRRGWILSIALVGFILPMPQPAQASFWDDLWLRQDQQASKALQAQQYKAAEQLAVDPLTRGSAAYKQGNYQQAFEQFSMVDTATAAYNKGNALAHLKQYKLAIKAYEKALGLQPDMKDAQENKAKIEALLKKQEEKKKQQQKQNKQNKQDKSKKDKKHDKNKKQNKGDKKDSKQGGKKGENQQDKEAEKDPNQFDQANKELDKKKLEKEEAQEKSAAEQKKSVKQTDAEKKAQAEQAKEEQAQQKAKVIKAEMLNDEEKMAADQWLKRIPDDPGGLLRRKFKYQYQQQGYHQQQEAKPW